MDRGATVAVQLVGLLTVQRLIRLFPEFGMRERLPFGWFRHATMSVTRGG